MRQSHRRSGGARRDPDTRTDLPTGQPGEIAVRSPTQFEGYLRDREKTAAAIDADGWFYTEDAGVLDETGHLLYTARIKDMLKVGGENVAPAEIEHHLGTHDAVALAQVVGVPDDRLGEVPVAFVELLPETEVDEATLMEHCSDQMARFKVPREIRFVTEWPMSASKIQKYRLRELALAREQAQQ